MELPYIYQINQFSWFRDAREKKVLPPASHSDVIGAALVSL